MPKKRFSRIMLLSFIVICMMLNMTPVGTVYAASAPGDLYTISPKLFPFINDEDLKAKIINSPDFIKNHALLAHYLGFGWAGGTGSNLVGEDFDFRKDGDKYILQARYNKNDPYSDGYWADKRLKMTISNVRFYIAPETLVTGQEKITDLDPITTQSYQAINRGDTEDTATTSFTYSKGTTVSHSTNYSFTEGIAVKHTAKIDVKFFSAQLEYGWNFSSTQGWSDSTSEVNNTQVTTNYSTTVPAKSKKTIKLMSFKTKSEVPYTANIYMDYDITYSGFLRWGGNARSDHPTNRPMVNVTFGSGDLTAQEEIANMYNNRHIPGYSNWDWSWMEKEFGANNVKAVVSYVYRPMGATMSGKFTALDGTHVQVIADDSIPLTDDELNAGSASAMTTKSLDGPIALPSTQTPGITVDNFVVNDSPLVHPIRTTVTTKNGTIELLK